MSSERVPPVDPRQLVLTDLALDALARRAISALEAAGVRVLLMKGPVTRHWLYESAGQHVYTDVDLLVDPAHEAEASSVMRSLGLRDLHAVDLSLYRPPSERAWLAPEGVIDLHVGLVGIPARRWPDAWALAAAQSEQFLLRGQSVGIMGVAFRTMHVALHAAQRSSGVKAVGDLEMAVRVVPAEVWRKALELAQSVDAEAAFAAGLERVPSGRDVLARLGPRRTSTTLSLLHARGAASEALALAQLAAEDQGRRVAVVRSWFQVEDATKTRRGLWLLRAAAVSRFPRALVQWLGASWTARCQNRRRSAAGEGGGGG